MTTSQGTFSVSALVRREMIAYARSPLFLIGSIATIAISVVNWGSGDGTSSTMSMIVPAAFIGLLGLIVMAMLTTRSDRAAAVAGTVAVGERTRTLALIAAVAVPFLASLAWFAAAVLMYRVNPPSTGTVPFGPLTDSHVLTVMFSLGVMPAVGGPVLGIVVARWAPWRGSSAVAAVVLVVISILLQGNFEATWTWRVAWPWTYWYGPLGWGGTESGPAHWAALPGSPGMWLIYLVTLCALGGLVALYHDPEGGRSRTRTAIVIVSALAIAALVLTMALGLDAAVRNPILGPIS